MSGNCAEENPSLMSVVRIGRLVVDLRKAKGSQVTTSCSQGKSFSKYTTHLSFGAWYSKIIPIKVASEWILNYFLVDFNNRNLPFLLHESLSLCLFTPGLSQKIFFALSVTTWPHLLHLIRIRVKTFVYSEGGAGGKQRCAKCQGWWGGSGRLFTAAIVLVFS